MKKKNCSCTDCYMAREEGIVQPHGKIPAEKMDAVDRQQQNEIESARNLAWGAIWVSIVVTVLNFGAFVMALWEMGQAIDVLKMVVGK